MSSLPHGDQLHDESHREDIWRVAGDRGKKMWEMTEGLTAISIRHKLSTELADEHCSSRDRAKR